MLRRYVLGFYLMPSGFVLIQKSKPEWARGKWNGLGGSIEEGETPIQAMVREFFEEAHILTAQAEWQELLTLGGDLTKTTKPWEMVVFFAQSDQDKGSWPRYIDEGRVDVMPFEPSPMDTTARWLMDMCWDLRRNGITIASKETTP